MLRCALMMALAVASSFALPQFHSRSQDRVNELAVATVDFLRATYGKIDPQHYLRFELNRTQSLLQGLIKVDLQATNITYSGFSNVAVDILETDPKQLNARLRVIYPEVSLACHYVIDGDVYGQGVSGAGQFEVKSLDWVWTLDKLQLVETENKALRVKSLGLSSAKMAAIPVVVSGLNAEGMSIAEFEESASEALFNIWELFEKGVLETAEASNIKMINEAIGDRTLEEVIQWLKDHKDGVPAENYPLFMATSQL